MPTSVMNDLRLLVSDIAQQVTTLEREAREVLQRDYSEESYRAIMRQKATLLASLHKLAAPSIAKLPQTEQTNIIDERLMRFSQSASNALNLNSVFYMSALLFPEDHEEGAPNDLEQFIEDYLQ